MKFGLNRHGPPLWPNLLQIFMLLEEIKINTVQLSRSDGMTDTLSYVISIFRIRIVPLLELTIYISDTKAVYFKNHCIESFFKYFFNIAGSTCSMSFKQQAFLNLNNSNIALPLSMIFVNSLVGNPDFSISQFKQYLMKATQSRPNHFRQLPPNFFQISKFNTS